MAPEEAVPAYIHVSTDDPALLRRDRGAVPRCPGCDGTVSRGAVYVGPNGIYHKSCWERLGRQL